MYHPYMTVVLVIRGNKCDFGYYGVDRNTHDYKVIAMICLCFEMLQVNFRKLDLSCNHIVNGLMKFRVSSISVHLLITGFEQWYYNMLMPSIARRWPSRVESDDISGPPNFCAFIHYGFLEKIISGHRILLLWILRVFGKNNFGSTYFAPLDTTGFWKRIKKCAGD